MKYRMHCCISCEGAIAQAKHLKGNITVDGKTLNTVKEVRDFFREQLAMGRKVMPMCDCDNFDYQTGCKGHVIEDNDSSEVGRMREILFRGKRVDEYGWVYGDLIHDEAEHNRPRIVIGREYSTGTFFHAQAPRVIPETVGQFTGLTDKNGKKIFEGDIVTTHDKKLRQVIEWTSWDYPDEFDNVMIGTFMCKDKHGEYYYISKDDEIVGNIHDNPELLEEEI